MAGKAMAQTVTVAATAREGSNDDWDNLDMAVLLWLRQRYRKFPDCLHVRFDEGGYLWTSAANGVHCLRYKVSLCRIPYI